MERDLPRRFFLITLLLLAGCESQHRAVDGNVGVRDSAGVQIITSNHEPHPLQVSEVIRIGVVDGAPEYLFNGIRSVMPDPHGGIWVADAHRSLRHYDMDGVLAAQLGGRGSGPGEAEGWIGVAPSAEEIMAWGGIATIHLFRRDGTLVGSRSATVGSTGLMTPIGQGRGRWFVALQPVGMSTSEYFRRPVHIVSMSGLSVEQGDTVRSFAGEVRRMSGREIGRGSYFWGNPSYGLDGQGRLYLSDTLDYRVAIYDSGGLLERIVVRPVPAVKFKPEWVPEIRSAVEVALRGRTGRANPAERDRLVAGIIAEPIPQRLPVIRRILVSEDGSFWVERADLHPRPAMRAVAHAFGYARHAWPAEWLASVWFDVFGADGRYRGTVELPPQVELLSIGFNRAYGVSYDDLGVEYVTVVEMRN